MSAKYIVAAALALSASSLAFAEAPYPVEKPFVSHTTRAAVKAELAKAQEQGLVNQGDAVYPIVNAIPANRGLQTAGAQTSLYTGA
ncbi:DUF4148 domain-containing protein [Herbaspirillum sp. LeCh32-8]|uniref:DUF4148 domain-containing protein n=1 Tax=Herbaspirillum sp. LeCh32-8 TaxID=2821356 RepID=UPI001AE218E7|nr:DUF4148 domain-containing protein [Herbaspirillum sp. LeCh32-8]MBP0598127.1 DUF4148 domain-containing protein [Herbaspirillum sp. LeCh32-8]